MFCSVPHCAMLLAVELEHLSGHVESTTLHDSSDPKCHVRVNPLISTLKTRTNGPLFANTVIGTLTVDEWVVTLVQRRGAWAGQPAQFPLTVPNVQTAHSQCTNLCYSIWHYICAR